MNYPYSDISRIRTYPVWVSALLMFVIWLGAQILVVPVLLPLMLPALLSGEVSGPGTQALVIVLGLLVSSFAMIAMVLFWSSKKEGRRWADIGLQFDPTGWRQYRNGLAIGVLFALSLVMLSGLLQVGLSLGDETKDAQKVVLNWSKLGDPLFWAILIVMAAVFAVQGAAEEILCRGWLLSSIAAQKNLLFSLFFSSFLFASLHVHYFFIDGLNISLRQIFTGIFGISAMFGMGLMLGMVALRDRSIMGASGVHSAFNFSAITFGMIMFTLTNPQETLFGAFLQSFSQSTDLNEIQPTLIVQLLLSASVAIYLIRRFGFPDPSAQLDVSKK